LIEDINDLIENETRKRLDRDFHQKIGPVNLPDIKFTVSELIALYLLSGLYSFVNATSFGDIRVLAVERINKWKKQERVLCIQRILIWMKNLTMPLAWSMMIRWR